MESYVYDCDVFYQVCITDGTESNSFSYNFSKEQDINVSIQESLNLANNEISKRDFVPKSI